MEVKYSVDVFTILKCRKEKEKVEPAAEGSKTKGLKKQVRPSPPMTRRNSEDKVSLFSLEKKRSFNLSAAD